MSLFVRRGCVITVQVAKTCLRSQTRTRVTTETGALLPPPKKTPFGIPRVILTVLPGLYLGATISKEGAAFLEENDIFVPDDDDDDED